MILDTSLQSVIVAACTTHNKSIDDLTTKDLLPEVISFFALTENTDYTFKHDTIELRVTDVLLQTFSINNKHSVSLQDFINTWHIMSDMQLIQELPSLFTKHKLAPAEKALLMRHGFIMNDEAYNYDNIYGRDSYIQQMVTILSRRKKSSVLLVGNPGCGKTAIVQGLVARCINNSIPKFKDYTFFSIQGHVLKNLASSHAGSIELENILRACQGKVIVFVDEFHTICSDERSMNNAPSVIDILKPALASGAIQIIGATTQQEAKKYVYHDKALTRRIQELKVEDMQDEDVVKILNNISPVYESFHHCRIHDKQTVVREIVKLSKRYLSDKFEPDRSIDIMDETLATISGKVSKNADMRDIEFNVYTMISEGKKKEAQKVLDNIFETKEDIKPSTRLDVTAFRTVIARKANVPADLLNKSDLDRVKAAEDFLRRKIIGQDSAVKSFVSAIRKFKTGLSNPNRPASILLVGPTGTGKTYICKETANILFDGRKNSFIRLDMTEFSASHSVSTLIGSPPGYVDSDKGGKLTEQVYRNPYSMILFDEIEKANDLVINILLQILDEGTLTDAMGKTVNFKNCIIVMTSNAGMEHVIATKSSLGFSNLMNPPTKEIMFKDIMLGLKKHFKPEFINRIDSTCVFGYLSKEEIFEILDLEINEVLARLSIPVVITQETKNLIVDQYYNEEYGARSIKRGVEDIIVDKIAQMIVDNPQAKELSL